MNVFKCMWNLERPASLQIPQIPIALSPFLSTVCTCLIEPAAVSVCFPVLSWGSCLVLLEKVLLNFAEEITNDL